MSEEGETIYRCRYSKDVHRSKWQAPTIAKLIHSPYTTQIARISYLFIQLYFLLYGNRWMGLTVLAGRLRIILEVEKKTRKCPFNNEPGLVYFYKSPILGSLSCCSTRTSYIQSNFLFLIGKPNNMLTLSCVFAGTFSPVSAAFLLERNIQLQSIGNDHQFVDHVM